MDSFSKTKQKRGNGSALLPYITHKKHKVNLLNVRSATDSGLSPSMYDSKRHEKAIQLEIDNNSKLREK